MELTNRRGKVIFALESAQTVLQLVTAAHKAGKSLRDADLRGADLRGADLSDADLRGAYLRGAYLLGADLRDADLSGAVLRGADLSGADLSGAVLRGAYLRGADLSGAVLRDADLSYADLRDAVLRDAVLSGGLEGVPLVPAIHAAVYEAASKPNALDMQRWHTCDTTHCRAGWVVVLAGPAGRALEWAMGTPTAAAVIYMRSDPKLPRIPDFYGTNEAALEDMKHLAEQESQPPSTEVLDRPHAWDEFSNGYDL